MKNDGVLWLLIKLVGALINFFYIDNLQADIHKKITNFFLTLTFVGIRIRRNFLIQYKQQNDLAMVLPFHL
jgi:hypothetical protein